MKHVPSHVKGVRPVARDAAGGAARRSSFSVSAAFAMIRKDIQELRRQTSRPRLEPAVFEQRLHELAAQVGALQGAAAGASVGPDLEAFLGQLQALLVQNLALFQQQVATTAAEAITGPAEAIRRDVASLKEIQASVDRRTQDTFEAVYGTIERIVDRLAAIEQELHERHAGAEPHAAAVPPAPMPSAQTALPADDADWAGLPPVQTPAAPEPAAAPADESWRMLRRPAVLPDGAVEATSGQEVIAPELDFPAGAYEPMGAAQPRGKALIVGIGAAVLTIAAAAGVLEFYGVTADQAGTPIRVAGTDADSNDTHGERPRTAEPGPDEPPFQQQQASAGGDVHDAANVAAEAGVAAEKDNDIDLSPRSDGAATASAFPAAAFPGPVAAPAAQEDILMRNVLVQAPPGDPWRQSQPSADPAAAPLPPAIGGRALIAAAQAGDPAAAYEIGVRFAQSRNGAPPDFVRAAAWLEKAAHAGLAPAQFRLGGMYEKGIGVRKDFAEARRLYMAAAAKGHVKAMHNLAVLYTRGIDGAPDYGVAAEWFRKAAAYGAVDSQYNLGILYARGSGVRRDLAESYKWFALAAKTGDKEAVHKRDEVAKGLSPKQLESAKASAEAFVPTPQPDEATTVKTPAGGWDQMAAAATTKSRASASPERFPER